MRSEDIINCVNIHNMVDLKVFFNQIVKDLKKDGLLTITDTVTNMEDAFINEIAFFEDEDHVRFYTPGEIISSAPYNLKLESYESTEVRIPVAELSIGKFMELPEQIKEYIKLDSSLTEYSRTIGKFKFRKTTLSGGD